MESSLIKNILPKGEIKHYHTYRLGLLIYGLILSSRAESYAELGCGYGYPLVLAGMALRDNCEGKYRLIGVDARESRVTVARNLLEKHGIRGETVCADAYNFVLADDIDIMFIDVWMRGNQAMIDKFAGQVKKVIIVHDVNEYDCLKFPSQFDVSYILESNCAIAHRRR